MLSRYSYENLYRGAQVERGLVESHLSVIEASRKIDDVTGKLSRLEDRRDEIAAQRAAATATVSRLRVSSVLGEVEPGELTTAERVLSSASDVLEQVEADIVATREALGILQQRRAEVERDAKRELALKLGAVGREKLEWFAGLYAEAMEAFAEVVRAHRAMAANGLIDPLHFHDFPELPELDRLRYIAVLRRAFGVNDAG